MAYDIQQSFQNLARYNERVNRELSPESPVLTDPRLDPPSLSWEHDLHDNFAGLRKDRTIVDERIRAWFEEFPAARYDEDFEYQDSVGNLRHAKAGPAFEFLFLHQTHHRVSLAAMPMPVSLTVRVT